MSSNLNSNFETMFKEMENFVTTKTVVGDAITVGDIILLPLVDVSFGLGAGGVEMDAENEKASGGRGGGLGAKITPSAVLVVSNGNVQLVNVKNQDSLNKIIDMVPGVMSKLNLDGIFDKFKSTPEAKDTEKSSTIE